MASNISIIDFCSLNRIVKAVNEDLKKNVFILMFLKANAKFYENHSIIEQNKQQM